MPQPLDFETLLQALPEPTVVLTPDLVVRHVNTAFLTTTATTAADVLERHLIDEVFPDKPGSAVPGRLRLRASFEMVRQHEAGADVAGVARYDIAPPGSTRPQVRYWSPVNSPVFDDRGAVRFIIHRVQDVTAARSRLTSLVATAGSSLGPAHPDTRGIEGLLDATQGSRPEWSDGELAEKLEQLRQVVDGRSLIDQAKGMLMANQRIGADEAFELLRQESQHTNVKLRDVAAHHLLMHSRRIQNARHRPDA